MEARHVDKSTYRTYRFVNNNLPVLAAELNGIHQRVGLAIRRRERLSNVLDRLVVIIDLRQINGISPLR